MISSKFDKAVLFTRPRRFGKTLTMTMFRDFLDIRQDSRKIFEGLKVMSCQRAVDGYMNKYPVIFMSLKEIFGADIDRIYDNFKLAVSELCKTYKELLNSDVIDDEDKIILKALRNEGLRKLSGRIRL